MPHLYAVIYSRGEVISLRDVLHSTDQLSDDNSAPALTPITLLWKGVMGLELMGLQKIR